jgi:hypothetical protein
VRYILREREEAMRDSRISGEPKELLLEVYESA